MDFYKNNAGPELFRSGSMAYDELYTRNRSRALFLNNAKEKNKEQQSDQNEPYRFHEDGIKKDRDQDKNDLRNILFPEDGLLGFLCLLANPCPDEDNEGHDPQGDACPEEEKSRSGLMQGSQAQAVGFNAN